MMRNVVIAVAALMFMAGCATIVPPPARNDEPPLSKQAAVASYARVLDRYVGTDGTVDFPALAQDRRDLDRYIAFVAGTPFTAFAPGPELLAHYINSYNALSIYNVIESGIPTTHAGLNKVRFFVLRKFTIGGKTLSLQSYENDVIRPLGEPRVHFALNCSAVSCPILPRHPFAANALDTELERETRAFFTRTDNYRVDDAAQEVWLNEVLRWYEEDFVPKHATSLLEYAGRYAPSPAPAGYTLRFVPYDWTVANSRSASPSRKPSE